MRQETLYIMIESIDTLIISKIRKARGGTLFFIEDFLSFGNSKAISKALQRLVEKGELSRVARGMYARLQQDPILVTIYPIT